MMPDGNLLIAFKWLERESHDTAKAFFDAHPKIATCPITELNLLRVLMQKGHSPREADLVLADFVAKHRARLIPPIFQPPRFRDLTSVIARVPIRISRCSPKSMA